MQFFYKIAIYYFDNQRFKNYIQYEFLLHIVTYL